MPKESTPEKVDLLRGGEIVSSLASAFGSGLRETRLTAILGYLVALEPEPFRELFGFDGKVMSVGVESVHDSGRVDIEIETTEGVLVVEAKTDSSNPLEQTKLYAARWRVLLTQYHASPSERTAQNILFLRWRDLWPALDGLTRSTRPDVRFLSSDLLKYLEAHHLIKKTDLMEIYAREINNAPTLELFLKGQIYTCKYQKNSRLPQARYFAPHFAQQIAREHPGVQTGISYIAKIEDVEVAESMADFKAIAKNVRKPFWMKKYGDLVEEVVWSDSEKKSLVFLGAPRLVFNPAIRKGNLQEGKGWLSRNTFTFDELFEAWGC